MQFTYNGKAVKFAGNETVTCNGISLVLNELLFAYAANVPAVAVGGTYTFVYTQSGTPTTIIVTAPAPPQFVSPVQGATVNRGSNLTITYAPDGGTGIDVGASDGSTGIRMNIFLPDNGTYTGLNTSSLKPSPGTLSLIRRYENTLAGSGFRSAKTQYDKDSVISVTWQ
jgi:hypothetical protein